MWMGGGEDPGEEDGLQIPNWIKSVDGFVSYLNSACLMKQLLILKPRDLEIWNYISGRNLKGKFFFFLFIENYRLDVMNDVVTFFLCNHQIKLGIVRFWNRRMGRVRQFRRWSSEFLWKIRTSDPDSETCFNFCGYLWEASIWQIHRKSS